MKLAMVSGNPFLSVDPKLHQWMAGTFQIIGPTISATMQAST